MRSFRLAGPILLAALAAAALTAAVALIGPADEGERSVARAQAAEPAPRDEPGPPETDDPNAYRCVQPEVEIPKSPPCTEGRGYPECRWQLPDEAAAPGLFSIWRNTIPAHRWGRPGLVSLILGAAAEYARRWPNDHLTVGDLDAPGPRHQTHDRGVDVDLYLPDAMMTRNEGRGRYVNNYAERTPRQVRLRRERVMDLARILAVCAGGQVRIYYNDPEIVSPFRSWFEQRGLRSRVGLPMRPHNRLHEFHFHLTIPEDQAPLPTAPLDPTQAAPSAGP